MFPLEHFYYGQLVHHGKPQDEMRVLAKTPGIGDAQVNEALRFALFPAHRSVSYGTWAIVRGKSIPFIMVQSQVGSAGQHILHFVFMTSDALRGMTGNVKAMKTLLKEQAPIYNQLGDTLPLITLTEPQPRRTDEQVDDLLDLMTYTKNNTRTIEPLLSAVVNGKPLVIYNAPHEFDERIGFIHGLLTLLPASTRFGVTFSTYTEPKGWIPVQVSFISDDPFPENSMVYHWEAGKVIQGESKDDYSRFIISQLRLDAELVTQQTEKMTAIAGWRFRKGDSLSSSLSYGSYRIKLDDALLNNQPVEIADVSKVLSQDPTLSDDLRLAYARHLINLSLALEDMQHADPVAVLLRNHPELGETVYTQMEGALHEGKAYLIYDTLLKWMSNPLSPQGQEWVNLTNQAALTTLDEILIESQHDDVVDFVERVEHVPQGVTVGQIVPQLISRLLPLVEQNGEIAMPLLRLGMQHLDPKAFNQLMLSAPMRPYLPQTLKILLVHLNHQALPPAPEGTLMAAVEVFGENNQQAAMVRFTNMARESQRLDLVDGEVLSQLSAIVQSTDNLDYIEMVLGLVNDLNDYGVTNLQDPVPRYMLQILLVLNQYPVLAKQMIAQSRDYYGVDGQLEYIEMVHDLFSSVSVTADEAETLIIALKPAGIKGLPITVASIGLLKSTGWSHDVTQLALNAMDDLDNNPRYLQVIPPTAVLNLLQFYATLHDIPNSIYVGGYVPVVAANKGDAGLPTMNRMMKLMAWDRETKRASFDYLREYIRRADDGLARKAVERFGKNMKSGSQRRLEVSYRLSRFMAGMDLVGLTDFSQDLGNFLQDMVNHYHKNRPSLGNVLDALEFIRTGFSATSRQDLSEGMLRLAKTLVLLGQQHQSESSSRATQGLLEGSQNPNSILDIFRVIAGTVGGGREFQATIRTDKSANPFQRRSGDELLDILDVSNRFLQRTIKVTPPGKDIRLSGKAIQDEIDSQFKRLAPRYQDYVRKNLPRDLQQLINLIVEVHQTGNERALEADSNLARKLDGGDQQPSSVLELMRLTYGYFT